MSSSLENIDDHKAYTCQCGSVKFNLLKSGRIECSGCGEKDVFVYGIPCPECSSIDTGTKTIGGNNMIPEQDCEYCSECFHEWNHR